MLHLSELGTDKSVKNIHSSSQIKFMEILKRNITIQDTSSQESDAKYLTEMGSKGQ